MESQFENVMRVLSKHANTNENYLISLIFNSGDITHLTNKLEDTTDKYGYYLGVYLFYKCLDTDNQLIFNMWFNSQIESK